MFRDLKEYQEIAKIYTEKVSKPEDLEERVRGGGVSSNPVKPFEKPAPQVSGRRDNRPQMKGGIEIKKPTVQGAQGRTKRPAPEKPMPTTAEIRAKDKAAGGTGMSNIPSKEGSAVIDGKKLNPDFGKKVNIKKEFPDKKLEVKKPKMGSPDSKFIKKDKGVGFVKRGTPMAQRAENKEKNKMRAQEMAKKRIAAKKEGTASTPMSGKEKAQAMAKARIAAKNKPVSGGSAPKAAGAAGGSTAGGGASASSGSSNTVPSGSFGISAKGKEQAAKNKAEVANKKTSSKVTTGTGGGTAGATSSAGSLEANKKKAAKMKEMEAKRNAMEKEFEIPESNQFDAYDLVLDYLLSSEQVATIEEANYVMTEMDAETIQGIVEAQKKTLMKEQG